MSAADSAAPFIFLIAGEPSGDALGAALIAALRQRAGSALRVAGIGGERMREQGIESLVALEDLAVFGLVEVLPRVPLILRRIREVAAAVRAMRPDAVVTIDSPDFTWRVAARLRKQGEILPVIHYVAPMVWAWRAGRARKMARWYDHLLALLPFEPRFFENAGLACTYVGHPVLESGADRGDAARFRTAHGIGPEELVVTVLPGSRGGEVRRHLPMLGDALGLLQSQVGHFRVAVPTVATVADAVAAAARDWPGRPVVLRGNEAKYDAFAASRAALAASGTVTLEVAMARLPMAVFYRMNRLTEALLRRLVRVRQYSLVNLLAEAPVVPELMGASLTAQRLAAEAAALIGDERVRAAQRQGYDDALRRLGAGEFLPSLKAADVILAVIAARRPGRDGAAPAKETPR